MTGYRPIRWGRITNPFAAPGSYASRADSHGPAGHHTGTDWGKSLTPLVEIDGKPVRSCTPGTVTVSEWNEWAGNMVGVYYVRDDVLLTYWHMAGRNVKVGDLVQRGDVLGRVGSTGNSTAPHLHVQANRGRSFDYHGHISSAPWARGVWSGSVAQRALTRAARIARVAARRADTPKR